MNIHCKNDWLFHLWSTDGECIRGCGATAAGIRDPHLRARDQTDVTVVHDQSLSASPLQVRPVDPASQRVAPVPLPHSLGDGSSFAVVASSLACWVAL